MIYAIECEAEEIGCELWLNDIPVTKRGNGAGTSYNGPVNQYLIEGTNEICLEITPKRPIEDLLDGPTPANDGDIESLLASTNDDESSSELPQRWSAPCPPGATIKAGISIYPIGAIYGGPDAVHQVRIEISAAELEQCTVWPLCVTARFDIGAGPGTGLGRMAWQDAERIDLNDSETRAGIMGLLRDLHRALDSGDHDRWLDIHSIRLADHDRCYGDRPGKRLGKARKELTRFYAEGLRLAPLVEDDSTWRSCGEGHLVQCLAPDGFPNIREEPDEHGATSNHPIFAGRIDGRWYALRT